VSLLTYRGMLAIAIHRSAWKGIFSRKFISKILHSPGPMQQIILCRVLGVHSPVYIRLC
jgi:hypothetical protein